MRTAQLFTGTERLLLSVRTYTTERNWYLPHNGGRQWSQDGGVEDNWRMTLPERPYRCHWEFQIKNKNKDQLIILDLVTWIQILSFCRQKIIDKFFELKAVFRN